MIDTFIVSDERTLPAVCACMNDDNVEVRRLASQILDFCSILEANRSMVCCAEGVLDAVVKAMSDPSPEVRHHLLRAMVYLAENTQNTFSMTRFVRTALSCFCLLVCLFVCSSMQCIVPL